jgi:cephalosporin hydroxylase
MTFDQFEGVFWDLWYRGQTEEEKLRAWFPAKRPTQMPEEFLQYLWLVSCVRDSIVVEIGVKDGHTRRFYEELLGCAIYIGVDINDLPGVDVVGDSTDPGTVEKIKALIPKRAGKPDIIFIDGDHSKDAVRKDYELYKDLVGSRGFLALHDTHHDHAEYCDGAARLWPELEQYYERTWDIFHYCPYMPKAAGLVNVRKQCGIGVIQMGGG